MSNGQSASLEIVHLKSEIGDLQASQKHHIAQEKLVEIKTRYYGPFTSLILMFLLTSGTIIVTKLINNKNISDKFQVAKDQIVMEVKQLQVDNCKIRVQKSNEKLFISIEQLKENGQL